ncbi:ribonuclease [Bacillus toyonensis]|uniref:ribonuclease n=1 Tax=Bacillus toyonensis TaxID=155322 RepID=UPI0015D47C83|nr:ribonuclease [Bacillus toyonensis]
MKNKLLTALSICALIMGLSACSSNETASTSNDSKTEEKARKAEEKEKVKKEKEEQKEAEKQRKQQEKEKKEQEKKATEEQKKQQEESKKQENSKPVASTDKATYETEIKPTIDEMVKEYDEIWNQDWRPIWGEAGKDPESLDKNALKEKIESVTNRYDALSKKNTAFKGGSKLTNPVLKEKIEKFRVDFGLATNYRSNAGRAVTQGLKGLAPMKDRMDEAQKSIKLSDQKLINAVASLTEVESKLGVKR